MKKRGTSRLSILLAICLIVTAIPMSSAADNTRATTDTSLAGTYILYNRFMDTFAGVASTSYTQGTAVQQQQYSGLSPQIWTVTPVSGTTNRYYIKMGSLCIGTASNGNTAYLQIPYGTSATYQQWYLDPIQVIDGRYGRYKIRTANSYYAASLVLSVDATLNSQLRLSSYINDSTYSDEWFLCPIDEAAINLEVRYESGYAARYSSPTSTLNAHMKEIQKRYITEFGIWINYSSPSSIQTLADQCNASLNGYCQCGTCVNGGSGNIQTYHHTNIHNIIYNLSLPTPANMFRLLFIGRYTCTASDHTGGRAHSGIAYVNRRTAAVSDWTNVLKERAVALHEFGHFNNHFRIPNGPNAVVGLDHYTPHDVAVQDPKSNSTEELMVYYPNDGYSDDCIYGPNAHDASVYSFMEICGGCMKRILECRANYYV